MIRAIALWLLALAAISACAPGLSAGVAALLMGVGDAARILAAGVAVAVVLCAGGLVWALKPQPPRALVLYERTVVLVETREPEQQALGTAVEADWVEVYEHERMV